MVETMLNPITGRYVAVNGAVGKKLQKLSKENIDKLTKERNNILSNKLSYTMVKQIFSKIKKNNNDREHFNVTNNKSLLYKAFYACQERGDNGKINNVRENYVYKCLRYICNNTSKNTLELPEIFDNLYDCLKNSGFIPITYVKLIGGLHKSHDFELRIGKSPKIFNVEFKTNSSCKEKFDENKFKKFPWSSGVAIAEFPLSKKKIIQGKSADDYLIDWYQFGLPSLISKLGVVVDIPNKNTYIRNASKMITTKSSEKYAAIFKMLKTETKKQEQFKIISAHVKSFTNNYLRKNTVDTQVIEDILNQKLKEKDAWITWRTQQQVFSAVLVKDLRISVKKIETIESNIDTKETLTIYKVICDISNNGNNYEGAFSVFLRWSGGTGISNPVWSFRYAKL